MLSPTYLRDLGPPVARSGASQILYTALLFQARETFCQESTIFYLGSTGRQVQETPVVCFIVRHCLAHFHNPLLYGFIMCNAERHCCKMGCWAGNTVFFILGAQISYRTPIIVV